MKVYHGSYIKIDKIDLSKCEPSKDFGRGFYVTKLYTQAEIWANRKGRYNHSKGVITEFNFFERAFSDKNTKFYKKNWTEIYKILLNEISNC